MLIMRRQGVLREILPQFSLLAPLCIAVSLVSLLLLNHNLIIVVGVVTRVLFEIFLEHFEYVVLLGIHHQSFAALFSYPIQLRISTHRRFLLHLILHFQHDVIALILLHAVRLCHALWHTWQPARAHALGSNRLFVFGGLKADRVLRGL